MQPSLELYLRRDTQYRGQEDFYKTFIVHPGYIFISKIGSKFIKI